MTADDWIQAGFAVLAEGGPAALRIGRLCDRLSVTKGSFYWHFTDMREYRASLAQAWGDLHDEQRRRFEESAEPDPRKRLATMLRTLMRPEHWALERAMRIWALTDESVLASVQHSDRRVRCAVRQAFIDYGFEPDEADLRSTVLFAAGVGLLHGSGSRRDVPAPLGERVLDLMLRR
ncbi:TetR family transcriptional regulator [Mycolicibacterium pulveris]|uniref:TetR family transcriptional regulator n=1 Tax=Mycolicibacterium pulveris TaxID=36813 RepID=A0A7I7UIZ8_MYCPV|nr:TetR family transcriptional regulator [Mycolicibacterium pulveris]